jgi:alkylated DNA repair dioxygenase AlkB
MALDPMVAPSGLHVQPELVSGAEERELVRELSGLELGEVRLRGQVARRRVAHFGLGYGYEGRALLPAPPIPPWLLDLRARAAELAGADPAIFVEVLVSWYPPGAGIGWHRDAPAFGAPIVGVSLAGACRLRLRRLEEPRAVLGRRAPPTRCPAPCAGAGSTTSRR